MALSDLLGIELVESTPDKYVTRMLVTENMLQPHGVLHGGISAALAENAASQCCTDHYDNDKMFFLGVEVSSTHLLPVKAGDTVKTVATPFALAVAFPNGRSSNTASPMANCSMFPR